jgi:hypothetical protein
LDHYLPKTHFPEYSILALNLVPMCDTCNRKKVDDVPGAVSWPHPYLDDLDAPYLVASVASTNPVLLEYRLDVAAIGDAATRVAVEQAHIRLELLERYRHAAISEVSGSIEVLAESGNECAAVLELFATGKARTYGKNHWRSAAWKALATDQRVHDSGLWRRLLQPR